MREEDAAALRDFLATRDVACPACGYNLRGLAGERCPECAQPLDLHVARYEPSQQDFLAGLIGLSCGAGFSGLLLIYALVRAAFFRNGGPPSAFLIVVSAGAVVQTVLLGAWLAGRSSFLKRSPAARRVRAVGCWIITVANLIFFTWLIR